MNEEKLKKQLKRVFTRLNYPLPSYKLSFEKHFEIIKAFVELSKGGERPVSWGDFKGLVSVDSHYVSANMKFFESIGLIRTAEKEKGKYYPTEEAVKFSKVLCGLI
jgi:predicted transcriptional regulator